MRARFVDGSWAILRVQAAMLSIYRKRASVTQAVSSEGESRKRGERVAVLNVLTPRLLPLSTSL